MAPGPCRAVTLHGRGESQMGAERVSFARAASVRARRSTSRVFDTCLGMTFHPSDSFEVSYREMLSARCWFLSIFKTTSWIFLYFFWGNGGAF